MTQTPSNSPVIISSTTEYTVSCTGLGSDTITTLWSLNRNSINSDTLIESHNSPFTVSSSSTFTNALIYQMLDSINVLLVYQLMEYVIQAQLILM